MKWWEESPSILADDYEISMD